MAARLPVAAAVRGGEGFIDAAERFRLPSRGMLKTAPAFAPLLISVGVLTLAGCPHKEVVEKATPDSCAKACRHVVQLKQEASQASAKIRLHELEEMFEDQEESAKKNVARYQEEQKIPRPKFEDTLESKRKVPASVMAQLRAQFEAQEAEHKRQLQMAIENQAAELKKTEALIAGLRKKTDADINKAFDDEVKRCEADCVQSRNANEVRCLQLAQAPDDVNLCFPQPAQPDAAMPLPGKPGAGK